MVLHRIGIEPTKVSASIDSNRINNNNITACIRSHDTTKLLATRCEQYAEHILEYEHMYYIFLSLSLCREMKNRPTSWKYCMLYLIIDTVVLNDNSEQQWRRQRQQQQQQHQYTQPTCKSRIVLAHECWMEVLIVRISNKPHRTNRIQIYEHKKSRKQSEKNQVKMYCRKWAINAHTRQSNNMWRSECEDGRIMMRAYQMF